MRTWDFRRISILSSKRQFLFRFLTLSIALIATLFPTLTVGATGYGASLRMRQFAEASHEFKVPKAILLAVSYNESRWENHNGEQSERGGYGLMHLTSSKAMVQDGKTGELVPVPKEGREFTLDKAAKLLGISEQELKTDDRQNIRGGAAVIANFQASFKASGAYKHRHNFSMEKLEDWYLAVARYADADDAEGAKAFIRSVYESIERGERRTTSDGQEMVLHRHKINMGAMNIDALKLRSRTDTTTADCPTNISCDFAPAAHVQNSSDPTDYGNYDLARRPNDMKIRYIVVHDTEGSYDSARAHFQDPNAYVSAHYLIRSNDGQVTQMVRNSDVAWHAGNWYMNMHSIGIEHEGYAAEGATWYTPQMYQASAKLVKYLSQKYDIPLDREHILGHSDYQQNNPKTAHQDPGPFWDWEYYMSLLQSDDSDDSKKIQNDEQRYRVAKHAKAVMMTPSFSTNKQPVSQCAAGTCSDLPLQSTNFVYLRTQPSETAPLLTDKGLHEDGSPGTTEINDTSARASYGQRFAVAGSHHDWIAIWFNGQKGWFKNTDGKVATPVKATIVTPRWGEGPVTLYRGAYPEKSAYPSTIPPRADTPLPYAVMKGQKHVAAELHVPTDYFYASTFNRTAPDDGTVVMGDEKYIPIWYNHTQAFVKAKDVKIYR